MKKFFSLVLALVMALSLTTVAWGAPVTTADELTAEISAGETTIYLADNANFRMPSNNTSATVKIVGNDNNTPVIDMTWGAYWDGATLSFEGVTIKTSTGYVTSNGTTFGSDYAALYSKNVTYTNCTFVGPMRVGRDGAKFINCTFTELGNDYVWTYGNDVTFEGCTFNTNGKAILIYSDGGNEISQVSVTGCTFNATTSAKAGAIANQNCAAIEVHNYGNGVNLTTSGNTIDTDFSGEWRIKTYEAGKPGITANGTEFTTIALDGNKMTIDGNKNVTVLPPVAKIGNVNYYSLAEAVAAAADSGDTIVMYADCDEDVTVDKALTFDFNGYTYSGVVTPAAGYTYMDGVVKKSPAASGTTSTGSVTSGTVTPGKAKLYLLATAGTSMTELSDVTKIELTTTTGKLVNDTPVYVPDIYKLDGKFYVEVAKADATHALKNNGAYVYLVPAGTAGTADAVIAKFATTVVLDEYVAAAEDVECGDAVKGTKGAAIYKSGNDAYYADGSNWAYFNGEFVKYDKNTKVAFKAHTWDATSIIVKATDVKGTKVPVTIECEDCEKTFSIVPSAKFDNTWVKGVNYTTDKAVDKYNTAAVKYYIVLENATYTGTYVPSTPSTDKVQSADTFDAGIAMYVGMSVMAAAGSVVVLKKRED